MARIRSSWWRPQPLSKLTQLSDDEIRRQEKAYRRWLRERWGCSEEDAELLIQVQRDAMEEPSDMAPAKSRIREEVRISDRVSIRIVRTHWTREHYEFSDWSRQSLALLPEIREKAKEHEPRWNWGRLPKPDAPTLYAVMLDGRRVDAFLTRGRARACAERLADEYSSLTKSAA